MFNFFKKTKQEPKNFKEVLKKIEGLEKDLAKTSRELKDLQEKTKLHFKKMGLVRYNPFEGIGGDQSFSLALLNDHDNGIVITSLFSREGNRVYSKTITKGVSLHLLSDEEKQAIKKAIETND